MASTSAYTRHQPAMVPSFPLPVPGRRPVSIPRVSSLLRPPIVAVVSLAIFLVSCLPTTAAQQITTSALAIVDAPQPGSTYHAGSNLPIALDVSGNGRLRSAAVIPGSGLPTRFDSLEIYLVSAQTNLNLTVSQGTGLLTQESGSTVKHLNYDVPKCVGPGMYNLTVYESSTIDSISYFSITPLLIEIDNPSDSGDCDASIMNTLQPQPQSSSPPPTNPWTGSSQIGATGVPTPITSVDNSQAKAKVTSSAEVSATTPVDANDGLVTITVGSQGLSWPFTLTTAEAGSTSLDPGQTVTRTIGGGGSTTVTIVVVSTSLSTLTTTVSGQATTQTTTFTSLSTTTAIMQGGSGDTAGFFPVNAGMRTMPSFPIGWVLAAAIGPLFVLLDIA